MLRRIDTKWVILAISVAIVAYLALMPLAFLLWQSFFKPHTAATVDEFTLENYRTAYSSAETIGLFVNSVQFAISSAVFAFLVGTLLASMNERTNTPFKTLFFALSKIS
jgi:iron(III) transport system permease protein